jgi:hypothetical protein
VGFHARIGGFDLEKVEKSDDTHFSAIVKEHGSDQFARISVDKAARAE